MLSTKNNLCWLGAICFPYALRYASCRPAVHDLTLALDPKDVVEVVFSASGFLNAVFLHFLLEFWEIISLEMFGLVTRD